MENNLFKKINIIKENILSKKLKKSGKNKFAGFDYYELSDILPVIIGECKNNNIFTQISFDNEFAKLIIINIDNPQEKVEYTSPMRNLELKGCNDIQALGGVETYQRRYLYMLAFDIVENDLFDATAGNQQQAVKKITPEQKQKLEELNVDKIALCEYFKVNSIENLTFKQAQIAISKKEQNKE